MIPNHLRRAARLVLAAGVLLTAPGRVGASDNAVFRPHHLVLSRSVYAGTATTVAVGQTLPPGCVPGPVTVPLLAGGTTTVTIPNQSAAGCNSASTDGTYPTVFTNAKHDGSFGVTSPIFLDQLTPGGLLLNTLAIDPTQIVTSFSSKSES